ncbi:MAG: LTA synthase family protein [Porticoccaceae bacterium]
MSRLLSPTDRTNPNKPVADLAFLGGSLLVLLGLLSLSRALLLIRNHVLAESVPWTDLATGFVIGMRFDLIIASYLLLIPMLALALRRGLQPRKLYVVWFSLSAALLTFLGIVELDFYHEFHARLNSLVFQYLREDPGTVASMLWNGFPVARYLLLWLVIALLGAYAFNRLDHATRRPVPAVAWRVRIPVFLLAFLLVAIACRGTLRFGPPLRWGDAYHSTFVFANHLALNGTFTLAKAFATDDNHDIGKTWLAALPAQDALDTARALVLTDTDQLREADNAPLLRQHNPAPRPGARPRNIVFIIMESFSAEFVGALGHAFDTTPEFDRLTGEGVLFERFFSNGTHTHQGMFASVACFPNLPGFEYLMQQPEGAHQFSGLGTLLSPQGFNNLYVYNGIFTWDNQNGFFRNQGFTRFIGRDDFVNPTFYDVTWGVSDLDMFTRAAAELAAMPSDKPFFAVLQSLSNHTPYHLPDPLPFAAVTGHGELNERLTAMKYSDWALGQFFAAARQSPYFKETLFVIVGDHGVGMANQVTDIDIGRFHVPALLIGPGLRDHHGARVATVGSQVDLVPTAVSQLGAPFTHQCWGRDLLSLPENDRGFAIIKPSGSDRTTAIVRDDRILVRGTDGGEHLYQYQFYPETAAQLVEDASAEPQRAALSRQLHAYIATAMRGLLADRTGANPAQIEGKSPLLAVVRPGGTAARKTSTLGDPTPGNQQVVAD